MTVASWQQAESPHDTVFVLIDGHALLYRAYHAFPELTTESGLLVNAVYGFTRILLTVIQELEPDYIAVAFDHPEPTFRHQQFEQYKAQRDEMPQDLRPQVELVKQVVDAFTVPRFELAGFEADDLIGTLAKRASQLENMLTVVVTGDKDLFQLVTDAVHVWIPGRGKGSIDTEYDPSGVVRKMGVGPTQITELKALMGDPSDNIPGVKGVGAKTAVKLLQEFGSIDSLYQTIETLQEAQQQHQLLKGALLKKLVADKDMAFLSRELATIKTDVPLEFNLDACRVAGYDKDHASLLLEELNFTSLLQLMPPDSFELDLQDSLF